MMRWEWSCCGLDSLDLLFRAFPTLNTSRQRMAVAGRSSFARLAKSQMPRVRGVATTRESAWVSDFFESSALVHRLFVFDTYRCALES